MLWNKVVKKISKLLSQLKVDVIRLPKTETAQEIIAVDKVITKAEEIFGCTVGTTKMMAAIESAEGVLNSRKSHKHLHE